MSRRYGGAYRPLPPRGYRPPVWETPAFWIVLVVVLLLIAFGGGYWLGVSRCPDCSRLVAQTTPIAARSPSLTPSMAATTKATVVPSSTAITRLVQSATATVRPTATLTPEPGWESAKEAEDGMTFVVPESVRLSADGKRLLVWGIFAPLDKNGKADLGRKSEVMEARWYPLCAEVRPAFAPEVKQFSAEALGKNVRIDYARDNGQTLVVFLQVVDDNWKIYNDSPMWKCLGDGVTEIK